MAWIPVIPPAEASGELKTEYDRVAKERGALANIFTVTSLHAGILSCHLSLYEEIQFGKSPLTRRERELVATVVSRENECQYCVTHHADALGRHAKEAGLQALVATDFRKAKLSERERAMAEHAVKLTRTPGEMSERDVERLRSAGLDDRAILDLTLVVAYFNFVNRLASGLGLTPEDVQGPYKY